MMYKADGTLVHEISIPVPLDADAMVALLTELHGADADWEEELEAVAAALAGGEGGRLEIRLSGGEDGGIGLDVGYAFSEGGPQGPDAERVLLALCLSALAQELVSPADRRPLPAES